MADAEPLSSSGGKLFAAAAVAPAAAVAATAASAAPAAKTATSASSANDDDGDSKDPAAVAERLRRRGNAAFAAGKYPRAGDLYRRALAALESSAASSPPLPGAGKLHSNLAAVALQLGRPRAALASCDAALRAEPTFGRAAVRAATCFVRLGEWSSAERALAAAEDAAARGVASTAGLSSRSEAAEEALAERDRVLADAAAKRAELAQLRAAAEEAVAAADAFVEGVKTSSSSSNSSSNASSALSKLSAVLSAGASPYALPARAARARLLLALGRPADAAAAAAPACAEEAEGGELAWQGWVRVQAAFFEGRLSDAAVALEARAQAGDAEEDGGDENDDGSGGDEKEKAKKKEEKNDARETKHPRGLAPPSAAAAAEAAAALRSLLAARSEGNAAYAASRFADAEAAYSRALLGKAGTSNGNGTSSSTSSSSLAPPPPAFAALLLANRGAARARAGDVAGALSDYLSARALAPGYAKAAARAGDLLAEVGLLDAACREYEEGLAAVKASSSSSSPSSSSSSSASGAPSTSTADPALASSLRSKLQALRSRIARASGRNSHGSQQQQQQVDSFKLLGLHPQREKAAEDAARRFRTSYHHQHWQNGDFSAEVARAISDADVRAAYRKAALAHHPDKAMSRLRLSDALCGGFGVKLLSVSGVAADTSSSPSGANSSSSALSPSSSSLSLHARLREAADFVFKAVGQARDALAEARGREAEDRKLTAAAARAQSAAASPRAQHRHHDAYSSSSSYYGYGFDDFGFDERQQRAWEEAARAQAQAQAHTRRNPYAW